MEKHEILEAAQKNKKSGCEYESKESIKSDLIASLSALIIGVVLFLIEYFVRESFNISLLAVGLIAGSVQSLYDGVRNKKTLCILFGCVGMILFFASLVVFAWWVVK